MDTSTPDPGADTSARAVRLQAHAAEWARTFEEEAERLRDVFDPVGAHVEHIGSTAVPGLVAKPIVDVLVGLTALSDANARVPAMERLGYEYVPRYESVIPDRRYFRRPRQRPRRFHVHCVERGGRLWTRHLAFRDHLRAHPDVAGAYGALKQELAERHGSDRDAYQEGKAPFIQDVLERAGLG